MKTTFIHQLIAIEHMDRRGEVGHCFGIVRELLIKTHFMCPSYSKLLGNLIRQQSRMVTLQQIHISVITEKKYTICRIVTSS